jgi:hypothetical protein
MSTTQDNCPNCGGTLLELKCSYCEITYVRCSCGHLNPTWVRDCPYCHASDLPSRPVELNEAPEHQPSGKSHGHSFYQHMRMLDAQSDEKLEKANLEREIQLKPPAPLAAPPTIEQERIDYLTEQTDPLEVQ